MSVRRIRPTPAQRPFVERLRELFTRLHWGDDPGELYQTLDPVYPHLVQMGRQESVDIFDRNGELVEVTYPSGSHLGVEYDWLTLSQVDDVDALFDPNHIQRLWLVADPRPELGELVRRSKGRMPINALSQRVGGRQAKFLYPPGLMVLPLGAAYSITYGTHKQGDDPASSYRHVFADEAAGVRPWLAADEVGRTYLVGGSYTVPPEGIRN